MYYASYTPDRKLELSSDKGDALARCNAFFEFSERQRAEDEEIGEVEELDSYKTFLFEISNHDSDIFLDRIEAAWELTAEDVVQETDRYVGEEIDSLALIHSRNRGE